MRIRLVVFLIAVAALGTATNAQTPGRDMQKEAAIWAQLQGVAPDLVDTFKEATTRMDQGDYPNAVVLYQRVVDNAPQFDPAIRRLGASLVLAGDLEHGLPMAEKAVSLERSPENLVGLAQLLAYPMPGKSGTPEQQARALSLALEAQARNTQRDVWDTVLVADLALRLNRVAVFREATGWLVREHPELMESHYFSAVLAATDEQWSVAEDEIHKAEKLGLNPEAVKQFLASGVQTRVTVWRYARYSAYLVALWAVGLLVLFLSGKTLSQRMLRSTTAAVDPADAASSAELGLRRNYRRLINLAGLYYYVSLPVIVFLVVALTASVLYGFYMLGRLPIQLVVTLVFAAVVTVYKMIHSLFVKQRTEDPGRALKRSEAPGLWSLVAEVAQDIGTRPVDDIRITPGTELAVYEKGTRKEKAQDKAQRVLILGAGVLNGFRVKAFMAVLGHEYGHFINRDTAGGEIALRVNRDMMNLAHSMISAGQNFAWNLAFQFLRLYHFLFRRISHGASRLQEVLADRVAAMKYGADAFEEGLRHVIRRSAEFEFAVNREAQDALKSGRTLANLYDLSLEKSSSVEKSIEAVLAGPTTDDNTHPCPSDRFRLVRQVVSQRNLSDTGMVWDLFSNREALTTEMSRLVGDSVRPAAAAPRQVPEKAGGPDRCAECGSRILFGGYADSAVRYCSIACYTAGPFPGFCEVCTAATTDENPGNLRTLNGIGTVLRPQGQRCVECHSVRSKKWFALFFIPIIPLKEYRVRWVNRQTYVGRKLYSD